MVGIVQAQVHQGIWFVLAQPLGFVLYGIAAIAEVNRAPFDLPEAEQELVAGYLTEFSGLRWSLFQMAEYINMITASSVAGDALLRRLDARRARAACVAAPFIWYLHQGGVLPLRLHLAARDAAAHPLRPVDALRLAGAAAALGAERADDGAGDRLRLAVVGERARRAGVILIVAADLRIYAPALAARAATVSKVDDTLGLAADRRLGAAGRRSRRPGVPLQSAEPASC